jgi:hypothetical protein
MLLFLMSYYPAMTIKRRTPVHTEEFFSTGQGYFEAVVVAAVGLVLNWIPCAPFIKYLVFLTALPTIHFSFTKRIKVEGAEVVRYPDISRPLNPDE